MKKLLLSFILMVTAIGYAQAADPVKGIMCTYDGSETTYAFSEVPTVKYVTEAGAQKASLYVTDTEEPVATFTLAEGKQLEVTYAEFTPTGINGVNADKATITEKGGKKYIQGGKLIIIGKDGKKYSASGQTL